MANYQVLYRIAVEHDYFNRKLCSPLECRLSPQSAWLARQRGLLFRQVNNKWTVFYDSTGNGVDTQKDVLELELNITDPSFILYTEWGEFYPAAAYLLELPAADENVDFISAALIRDKKRKAGTPFCILRLPLTEKVTDAAKAGSPEQALLQFHAPEVQWEYIFFSRNAKNDTFGKLILEDTTGKLKFLDFKECEASSEKVNIPMREAYESRLQLAAQNNGMTQKRTLLSTVPCPEPGRFQSGQSGVIRQVCYF